MKFAPYTSSLLGSLPRSRELMRTRRNLKKDPALAGKYQEVLYADTIKAIRFQESSGIEILTSGELNRDNYVSFVADSLNGVDEMSMAGLIEFMPDKMAFEEILQILDVPSLSIKNAVCTGKISRKKPIVADEMRFLRSHSNLPLKATLPGAYLLTRSMWVSEISSRFYSDKSELGEDVLAVLKEEIRELTSLGVELVQFDEPVLSEIVFSKEKTRSFMCAALSSRADLAPELEFATHLIREIVSYAKSQGILAGLHICRGNWSKDESILLKGSYLPLIGLMEEVLPDILFLEFSTPRAGEIETLLKSRKIAENCILGLGVINPRSDEIESPEFIVEQANKALKFIPKEQIWLNPDCGFATFANRPVSVFEIIEKKLRSLKIAQDILR